MRHNDHRPEASKARQRLIELRSLGLRSAALAALALILSMYLTPTEARADTCQRTDFEAVVDGAAETLRSLTQQHSPVFQGKLRQLREKRGWTHEQFLAEGAKFVRDEKIAEYDDKSEQLLARINSAGDGGGKTPDCALLATLKGNMTALVETQNAKWTHMFSKLDAELVK
ncbi:MAG: hypothetical protein ABL898_06835 [Hyphomicrobiaceae bacterium]